MGTRSKYPQFKNGQRIHQKAHGANRRMRGEPGYAAGSVIRGSDRAYLVGDDGAWRRVAK